MSALRHIRQTLGVSQRKLAEELGITQGSISFYERWHHAVPPLVAAKIIKLARKKGHKVSFDDVYSDVHKVQTS